MQGRLSGKCKCEWKCKSKVESQLKIPRNKNPDLGGEIFHWFSTYFVTTRQDADKTEYKLQISLRLNEISV